MAFKRTQPGLFASLGVFCLLSSFRTTVGLKMRTIPKYLATCGENLTLDCKVESEGNLDVKSFYWMQDYAVCDWHEDISDEDFECKNMTFGTSLQLSVTIFNVQPKHRGTYLCKLRAREGIKTEETILQVQNCEGNSAVGVTADEGTCTFRDVFPKPSVAWHQGVENLTHLATTTVTENEEGLFTIVSTIKLKRGSTKDSTYNCSLLMPIENEADQSVVKVVRNLSLSNGHMVTSHWLGVVLAMILGSLV